MPAVPPSRKGQHWRKRITAEMAQAALVAKIMLSPEETKALAEKIILEGLTLCDEYVTAAGPAGEGTIFLPDPDEPGALATKRNHPAVVAYLRELARMHGTDAPTKIDATIKRSPLEDLSDEALEALRRAKELEHG